MRMSKSYSGREPMEEALWVTVKDRVHCSMTELFLVPCNGLFGGLGPFKGLLKMKPVHHLLPSAPFFFFKILFDVDHF